MKDRSAIRVTADARQSRLFLVVLTGSALLLRLMVAYVTVHYFDLNYYVDWSSGVDGDLFGAYNQIGNLDYPPLFLFPLCLTGKVIGLESVAAFPPYMMLALKGWQLLFDTACVPLFYVVLRQRGELFGLMGAALWAVNPAILLNSSYWGQTDSIMIFLLVAAFWLLGRYRPVPAAVVMACACLMKFQSLYFAPVFVLYLLSLFPFERIWKAAGAGALTALAVFLPFMARSGWALPWEIYFGGFSRYPGASLGAFNLYGAVGLNNQLSDRVLFGAVTAEQFSTVMIAAALLLLAFLWFTATERSVWLMGFVFMQTIFLFTTRMHERYQIPAVAFALAACVWHRSRAMFLSYALTTVTTFFNAFIVLQKTLAGENPGGWMARYEAVITAGSVLNLALYALTLFFALRICYRRGWRKPPRPGPAESAAG